MCEGQLEIIWRVAPGEHREIREICADTLELDAGRLFRMHQLLDQTEIAIANSVLLVFN